MWQSQKTKVHLGRVNKPNKFERVGDKEIYLPNLYEVQWEVARHGNTSPVVRFGSYRFAESRDFRPCCTVRLPI